MERDREFFRPGIMKARKARPYLRMKSKGRLFYQWVRVFGHVNDEYKLFQSSTVVVLVVHLLVVAVSSSWKAGQVVAVEVVVSVIADVAHHQIGVNRQRYWWLFKPCGFYGKDTRTAEIKHYQCPLYSSCKKEKEALLHFSKPSGD